MEELLKISFDDACRGREEITKEMVVSGQSFAYFVSVAGGYLERTVTVLDVSNGGKTVSFNCSAYPGDRMVDQLPSFVDGLQSQKGRRV